MSGNPLSWPQEQCHIIDQLYPYSAVNIIGGVVTIEGIVDLPRLHAAIQSAIRQFDALRMWFVMGEESEVVSQVQPYHWRDIRHLTFPQIMTRRTYAQRRSKHLLMSGSGSPLPCWRTICSSLSPLRAVNNTAVIYLKPITALLMVGQWRCCQTMSSEHTNSRTYQMMRHQPIAHFWRSSNLIRRQRALPLIVAGGVTISTNTATAFQTVPPSLLLRASVVPLGLSQP